MEQNHFILLTDIARSSYLAEAFPQQYSEVLNGHNHFVETAITSREGEVVKGLGDGYLALFPSAEACLAAAECIQVELTDSFLFPDETPLRLRVACHAGLLRQAQVGGAVDYFGSALNRAARIAQVCNPGQVLVSGKVREALLGANKSPLLAPLGEHRLRDLAEPERLFQLTSPRFALQQFPPLVSLSSRPNNLVSMPGSFVGREQELSDLATLLRGEQRLITVVAPGGYGKSRLIAQLCANALGQFRDGVFEVRLASVTDPHRLPDAVGAALGYQFYGSREARDQIIDFLRSKELLLHFDNFDQLASQAGLLSEILETAQTVRIIVTSREPLRLRGEQIYRLGALGVDHNGDACRLFTERALQCVHDLSMDLSTQSQIEQICHLLDGVPLAIELAAAWVDSFTLEELQAEMHNQLELTARMGDVPERHRSVRASCDWSWERLEQTQQSLLRRCSVFRDGFFIDAGEAVLGLRGMELRSSLAELVDKSWLYTREVQWTEGDKTVSKTRWLIRDAATHQYAWQKLLETRPS